MIGGGLRTVGQAHGSIFKRTTSGNCEMWIIFSFSLEHRTPFAFRVSLGCGEVQMEELQKSLSRLPWVLSRSRSVSLFFFHFICYCFFFPSLYRLLGSWESGEENPGKNVLLKSISSLLFSKVKTQAQPNRSLY